MILRILLVISLVVYATAVHADDEVREALFGGWEGMLEAGGTQLTVRFHIGNDETGALTGTMDSPDQGVTGKTGSGLYFCIGHPNWTHMDASP